MMGKNNKKNGKLTKMWRYEQAKRKELIVFGR